MYTYENSAEFLNNILFDDNGLLIKFRFKKGLDESRLDELYKVLEDFKDRWKNEDNIPKKKVFYLNLIMPALYESLEQYAEEDYYEDYILKLYNLGLAISMCLNPDTDNPHFDTPLKNLLD